MRTKVEGTKDIDGDFTVETETLETNGSDFLPVLVHSMDLINVE